MHDSAPGHRVSPGVALPNARIHGLVDGERPLFAFFLIKVMTPEGPRWGARSGGDGVNDLDLYGALDVQAEILRQKLVSEWFYEDDDEDADESVADRSESRLPIDDVLGVLDIEALDSDCAVEFVFVLIKTLSENGTSWSFRTSAAPVHEELLGALVAQMMRCRETLAGSLGQI